MERPEIFQYLDYRLFLADWFEYLKSEFGISPRTLAVPSGVSESLISMVINFRRSFSPKQLIALTSHLKLRQDERSYLIWLHKYNRAKSLGARLDLMRKVPRFRTYARMHTKDIEMFEYLTHWYYVVIRECQQIKGYKASAKWIKKHLWKKMTTADINKALRFLKSSGLGFSQKGNLHARGEILRPAMAEFHRSMLTVGCELIESTPAEERCFLSHTTAISADQFDKYRKILEEARRKIIELAETRSSKPIRVGDTPQKNRVVHFGLAAFPLTRTPMGPKRQKRKSSSSVLGGSKRMEIHKKRS